MTYPAQDPSLQPQPPAGPPGVGSWPGHGVPQQPVGYGPAPGYGAPPRPKRSRAGLLIGIGAAVFALTVVVLVVEPWKDASGPSSLGTVEDAAERILILTGEMMEIAYSGGSGDMDAVLDDLEPLYCPEAAAELRSVMEEFDLRDLLEEQGYTDLPPIDIEVDYSYAITGLSIDGDTAEVDYTTSYNTPIPELSADNGEVTGWGTERIEDDPDTAEFIKENGTWLVCQ